MRKRWFLIAGGVAVIALAVVLVFTDSDDEPAFTTDTAPAAIWQPTAIPTKRTVEIPASLLGPKLAIVSQSCSTSADYITCEGFVKNISSTAIENVMAVIVYKDANGTAISSDDALIAYTPLLPDQSSPFKVLTRYNPAFTTARVEFKTLFGGEISTRDDSLP